MKRALIGSLLGIAVVTINVEATGYIYFANYDMPVYDPVRYTLDTHLAPAGLAGQLVADPNITFQLFWALGTYNNPESFLAAATPGVMANITPGVGYDGYYGNPNAQVLPNWTGGPVTFMVRGWETVGAYGGSDYDTSMLRGQSDLWQEVGAADAFSLGIQPTTPGGIFAAGPPPMTIGIVPEPAVTSLVLWTVGGFLILRRGDRMFK
jgi:hypothetical protein